MFHSQQAAAGVLCERVKVLGKLLCMYSINTYIYVSIYIYIYVCLYIYIYIYIYM